MKDSEKINELMRYTGMNGPQLAARLGFKRAQSIYFIRDGERPITLELARKIKKEWPEVSFDYLVREDYQGGILGMEQEESGREQQDKASQDKIRVVELRKEVKRLQNQVDRLIEQGTIQVKVIEALERKLCGNDRVEDRAGNRP